MKRIFAIFISLLLLISCVVSASAHPGSLDENGGHWNHSTGEYHYHDGKHTTGSSSGSSSNSSSNSSVWDSIKDFFAGASGNSSELEFGDILAFFGVFALLAFFAWVFIDTRDDHNARHTKSSSPPTSSSEPAHPNPQPPKPQPSKPSPPPEASNSKTAPPRPASSISPRAKARLESLIAEREIPKPNSAFFTPAMAQAFEESLNTDRLSRARSEIFAFENIDCDYDVKPIRMSCTIKSQTGHTYNTSLAYCSCMDYQKRHVVCKHMIALALWCGALTERAFSFSHILNAFLYPDPDTRLLALYKISTDYLLALSDSDIEHILASENPPSALEEYVAHGQPLPESLHEEFMLMKDLVNNRIDASTDIPENIDNKLNNFANKIANHAIFEKMMAAYTLTGTDCPPQLHFMVGKVNYYSAALACAYVFAQETSDEHLKNRIKEMYLFRTSFL